MPPTITRDAEYPPEAAALLAAFNQCCMKETTDTVLAASTDMLIMAVSAYANDKELPLDQAGNLVSMLLTHISKGVQNDLMGVPPPATAIPVPLGGH